VPTPSGENALYRKAIDVKRLLTALVTLALLAMGLVAAPVAQAAGGTTYAWTGNASDSLWTSAGNWSPEGVPGNGDSVSVGPTDHIDEIGDVPDVTLENVSLTGDANSVRIGDGEGSAGSITITGHLDWTGGDLGLPVTIAAGATGTVGKGESKDVDGGDLTVKGTLTLADLGDDEDVNRVMTYWEYRVIVAPGGGLVSQGSNRLMSERCCGADYPSALENHGTVSVTSGHLALVAMELDQLGTVTVAKKAAMHVDRGQARLGPAKYTGGGTLDFTNSSGPDPDPKHPALNQGGVLLRGKNTLANGFTMIVGSAAEMTGSGTFTGTGSLQLAGGTVYANAKLGKGIAFTTAPKTDSAFGDWDPDETGYHGHVVAAGRSTVAAGSSLSLHRETQFVVPAGGRLRVPGRGKLVSDGCCTAAPTLVNQHGGTIAFGGGGGTALLKWITFANKGTVAMTGTTTWTSDTVSLAKGSMLSGHGTLHGDVANAAGTLAPKGTLTIDGDYTAGKKAALRIGLHGSTKHPTSDRVAVRGTATLAGTLSASGTGTYARGKRVTVLTARSRIGTFGCVSALYWQAAYGRKGVTLTRIAARGTTCRR
jgi:hypothetical protein